MLRRTSTAALVAALALGACSSGAASSQVATTSVDATAATAAEPLSILVTNDDGIAAPGIDALVSALHELDAVEVTVVAPAENQSGTSDQTTAGGAPYATSATAGGVEGTAVDGFPADTIAVALDQLGLHPDLVVSGVNEGQNVGPLVTVSGTVGAARAAIRRGIPSVAASAGIGELADYDLGASLIVDWVIEHRDALTAGTVQTKTVTSFNVPGCVEGEPKDLVEVPVAAAIPEGLNVLETADCSIVPDSPAADDVAAMRHGYLAVSQVPAEL